MAFVVERGSVIAKRYRLERAVGEGGMGVVWAATHVVTGRSVALKFLKGSGLDEQARRRFLREARASGVVADKGVVAVHDILEADDGALALVMDLLDGEALAARLGRAPRPPLGETARIVRDVCETVRAAHAAGIVHRDLKPDNIFVTGDGTARVLDFGIAKLTGPSTDDAHPTGTRTGAVLGTPFYMSPEQAFGERDVDARADVWSLGLILYEALSNVLPTRADNVGQVLKIIVTGAIPPLGTVAPEVPPALADLVDRMLSTDRHLRPTLDDVITALAVHTGPEGAAEARWLVGPVPATSALAPTLAQAVPLLPVPETRYADTVDGFSIAYQTFGHGPLDLVLVPGIVSHVEALWEEPEGGRFFSTLGSFARPLV